MAKPTPQEIASLFDGNKFDSDNLPSGVTYQLIGDYDASKISTYDVTLPSGQHILIPDVPNAPGNSVETNSTDAGLAMQAHVIAQVRDDVLNVKESDFTIIPPPSAAGAHVEP